jgi:hypothetical protein
MASARLSRNLALMHSLLMTAMANERSFELRSAASDRRRSRIARLRTRRAAARRARHPFRVAHV